MSRGGSNQTPFPPLSQGWGRGYCSSTEQNKNSRQKCGMFIRQLSASQTSEHFLPEVKNVALFYLDSKKCNKIKIGHFLTKL